MNKYVGSYYIEPKILKRFFKYLLLGIFLCVALIVILNYPISSNAKDFVVLSDTSRIRKNLEKIINTPNYRNFSNVDLLDSVSEYIKYKFLEATSRVSVQEFPVRGASTKML